ncbi:RDD family protein [Pseudoxanthomonas sp. LH2527]|uniref:RDD family protein n=1 Tax=Pseudoxanthomonas sp. LH2527 TaxID=2923249 RepID=UPI001F132E1C|nr:RDD family protein [Pseudoxanthomonas sp. LH2527]MCH6482724.1 RDD family protein [Pseudoxanthomonas sp. LH2527]
MTQWYYADASGQRHGPFSAEELESHVRHARLGAASLVWREGLQDWQPLGAVATELNLQLDAIATPDVDVAVPAADAPYTPPTADLASFQPIVAGHLVHAGLWKRFAASFIDSIVTTVISYALMIPLMLIGVGVMGAGGSDNPFATGAGLASMLAIYPILFLAPCIYFGWMQSSSLQASLGKLAVGIKVARTDGQRMSFWRGFLRSLAYLVFTMVTCGLGVLISGLMVALTERKQALHDMLCDTLVVDKWAFTAYPERQRDELGVVTIVILALAGLAIVGSIAIYAVMGLMLMKDLS